MPITITSPWSTSATEKNLDLILAELQRRHIRVLVAGMKAAPNLGADYRQAFETIYPRLARRYGDRLYPFFLDGVAGRPALIQADGHHPNSAGSYLAALVYYNTFTGRDLMPIPMLPAGVTAENGDIIKSMVMQPLPEPP